MGRRKDKLKRKNKNKKNLFYKEIKIGYALFVVLFTLIVSASYYSYAMFTLTNEKNRAINIVTGGLVYELSGDSVNDQVVGIDANEIKIINVVIKSTNKIGSKYQLYYENDPEVEVNVIKGEGAANVQI